MCSGNFHVRVCSCVRVYIYTLFLILFFFFFSFSQIVTVVDLNIAGKSHFFFSRRGVVHRACLLGR